MSNRPAVKSAFENLRPTILREPSRSAVTPEAEARLLEITAAPHQTAIATTIETISAATQGRELPSLSTFVSLPAGPLLIKKKKERLLLVSFRMPQSLKEKLERVAKLHEVNQTDLINEAIELNLQRYL